MKWFKHLSGSLDDPFISDLIDEYGSDGYVVFFGILEILACEFDVKNPEKITVSYHFLRRKLRLSRQKVVNILNFCKKRGRFLVADNGDTLTIQCPKFITLSDEYAQRMVKKEIGTLSGQNPAIEEEEEEEEERTTIVLVDPCVEIKLSQVLLDLILKRRSNFKKPDIQKWAKEIDKMIRLDKRDAVEIEKVIKWCQGNEFWQDNVLSGGKLRKQYDQLAMKMAKDDAPVESQEGGPQACRNCGTTKWLSMNDRGQCEKCQDEESEQGLY